MNSREFAAALSELITEAEENVGNDAEVVGTLDELGYLTRDIGLVVRAGDKKFMVTVKELP